MNRTRPKREVRSALWAPSSALIESRLALLLLFFSIPAVFTTFCFVFVSNFFVSSVPSYSWEVERVVLPRPFFVSASLLMTALRVPTDYTMVHYPPSSPDPTLVLQWRHLQPLPLLRRQTHSDHPIRWNPISFCTYSTLSRMSCHNQSQFL